MIDDTSTHAYRIEDDVWQQGSGRVITWSVASLPLSSAGWFPSTSQLTSAEVTQAQRAFASWAAVADVTFVQVADSANVDIRLGNEPFALSTGIVGETTPTFDTRNHLEHAQIEFNTNYINQAAFTADNVYAVAEHEVGHALGLAHSTSSSDIMYFENGFESPSLHTQITSDDIAAIQSLFGAPGTAEPITDSTATTGAVAVGLPVTGTIQHYGDAPWYAVTLVAGQSYELDMKGAGTGDGTLTDPYLTLRDSSGNSLASDDDSGTAHNAHIGHYVAPYSGTYYLDAEAYTVHDTGSFTLSVTSDAPAQASASLSTDNATLFGAAGAALLATGNGQWLVASAGSETLSGGGLNDTLWGGTGADSLVGGSGNDMLIAGAGGATMSGGGGQDLYFDGSGKDVIQIDSAAAAAVTGVAFFAPGDQIQITRASWNAAGNAASQADLQIDSGGNAFLWLGHDPTSNQDKWIILLGTAHVAASDLVMV